MVLSWLPSALKRMSIFGSQSLLFPISYMENCKDIKAKFWMGNSLAKLRFLSQLMSKASFIFGIFKAYFQFNRLCQVNYMQSQFFVFPKIRYSYMVKDLYNLIIQIHNLKMIQEVKKKKINPKMKTNIQYQHQLMIFS